MQNLFWKHQKQASKPVSQAHQNSNTQFKIASKTPTCLKLHKLLNLFKQQACIKAKQKLISLPVLNTKTCWNCITCKTQKQLKPNSSKPALQVSKTQNTQTCLIKQQACLLHTTNLLKLHQPIKDKHRAKTGKPSPKTHKPAQLHNKPVACLTKNPNCSHQYCKLKNLHLKH